MENQFYRSPILPSIILVSAILFAFAGILQLATGNPVALFSFIACFLFLANSIWSFSTPYILLENNSIYIREAILNQKTILVSDILQMKQSGGQIITIHLKNQTKIKLRLKTLSSPNRSRLVSCIEAHTELKVEFIEN